MIFEYMAGKDSRKYMDKNKNHTVQVSVLVYNPVIFAFENPSRPSKANSLCRNVRVIASIPAYKGFTFSQADNWYIYRGETRSGALALVHLRKSYPYSKSHTGFPIVNEYGLFRLSKNSPLIRIEVSFDYAELSSQQSIVLDWRGRHISSHEQMLPDEVNAFKKFIGMAGPSTIVDATQEKEEIRSFFIKELEPAATTSVTRNVSGQQASVGKKPVAINRVRPLRR
jgi:hypothetical protein